MADTFLNFDNKFVISDHRKSHIDFESKYVCFAFTEILPRSFPNRLTKVTAAILLFSKNIKIQETSHSIGESKNTSFVKIGPVVFKF